MIWTSNLSTWNRLLFQLSYGFWSVSPHMVSNFYLQTSRGSGWLRKSTRCNQDRRERNSLQPSATQQKEEKGCSTGKLTRIWKTFWLWKRFHLELNQELRIQSPLCWAITPWNQIFSIGTRIWTWISRFVAVCLYPLDDTDTLFRNGRVNNFFYRY